MSKKLVYSVFDSKVGMYAQPFFMRTKAEALRGWQTVANDPETNIAKFPEDYSLFELGEYDEERGAFMNHPAPLNLGLASQYQNSAKGN